jgi:3-dehydroquinate synthase
MSTLPASPAVVANIGGKSFPVHLGSGLLDHLGAAWGERAEGRGRTVLLVADGGVPHLAERAVASLESDGFRVIPATVPPGEGSKSMAEAERLCRIAAREGLRRTDGVVALGGGVVGDLAGFVAASYQRGVFLAHVPTTLLAMVDSSIGGKTGVDLPEGKNYVGAIWQPDLVLMDVDALVTLPPRELSCGFAEVIKYGLLEGGDLQQTVAGWKDLPGPEAELTDLITRCVQHKLRVVAGDERDLGMRATLNLGHTVGHGIEAAAGYTRYLHGEAISLGLLAALRVSIEHLGLDPDVRRQTEEVLTRHKLPTRLDPEVSTTAILDHMSRDKKADDNSLNMVLLPRPGEPSIRQSPSLDMVKAAIEELRT